MLSFGGAGKSASGARPAATISASAEYLRGNKLVARQMSGSGIIPVSTR